MSRSGSRQIVCPNGHSFQIDRFDVGTGITRCPECSEYVATESSELDRSETPQPAGKPVESGTRRGLWAVMGNRADGAANKPAGESNLTQVDTEAATPTEPPVCNDSDAQGEAASRPRGLWSLMNSTDSAEATATVEHSRGTATQRDADEDRDDELLADALDESSGDVEAEKHVEDDEIGDASDGLPGDGDDGHDDDGLDDDGHDGWEVDNPIADLDGLSHLLPTTATVSDRTVNPLGDRRGQIAAVLGALGILLAGLALLPNFWWQLPSTVSGLLGLTLGYQAIGIGRRIPKASRPSPASAVSGIALGVLAIFAGPTFLSPLGDGWRRDSESRVVRERLVMIGAALNGYHEQNGQFPPGGVFVQNEQGIEVGQHGWMTQLLPWIQQTGLYSQINLQKSWDDPANRIPMRVAVPTYLTPGIEYAPTPGGYATAHYSGVGGRIRVGRDLQSVGLFDANSVVLSADVLDGRSNTLAVGEIVTALPAWGAPDNWRETGHGLNRQLSGFGNAAGTGAHFLMADGSVRFFSNRTGPALLERLSTRDAND